MKLKSCVVIDYGIGNVFSVMHALRAKGAHAKLTRDSKEIRAADRVILPGVGAFGRAANRLRSLRLDADILAFIDTKRPFLGICVGMQLLMSKGTEFGQHSGLDVIPGTVDKIDVVGSADEHYRIPLIGWHQIQAGTSADSFNRSVFSGLPRDAAFYFVHSYACRPSDPSAVLAHVHYGGQSIVAAIQKDNMIGVQFHPERSSTDGLAFIDNFLSL